MHRYNVLIGVPSSGTICEGTAQATYQPSFHHDFDRVPSHWSGPNFNKCWKTAMNAGMRGQYTHFAMVHADIRVYENYLYTEAGKHISLGPTGIPMEAAYPAKSKLWLDVLLEDMDTLGVPFISAPIAHKDSRGMLSCGIGDPDDPWTVWRRFCVDEMNEFPSVFTAADVGYADKYLIHSMALAVWDLRSPCWYQKTERDTAPLVFNFSEQIIWNNQTNEWDLLCQSEDWAYCRLMWRYGIPSGISRNVEVRHLTGNIEFPNCGDWGTYKNGDEELAYKWRKAIVKPREGACLEGV